MTAIQYGFTSVMMDGSLTEDGKTPASWDYNVQVTKDVVEYAHARGVTVEAELGCLGGIEDGHGAGLSGEEAMAHLTDPDEAGEFVKQTGCDALAGAGEHFRAQLHPDDTCTPDELMSEAVDHLLQRLQHLDSLGGIIREIVGAKTSHRSRLERSKVELGARKSAPKVTGAEKGGLKVRPNLPGGTPQPKD